MKRRHLICDKRCDKRCDLNCWAILMLVCYLSKFYRVGPIAEELLYRRAIYDC